MRRAGPVSCAGSVSCWMSRALGSTGSGTGRLLIGQSSDYFAFRPGVLAAVVFAAFFAVDLRTVGSGFIFDAVGTPVFFSGAMNFGFGAFFSRSGSTTGGRCPFECSVPALV